MKSEPQLSIVLPCYNGADFARENVPLLQRYLDEKGIDNEIIIVDDGSDDQSATRRAVQELGCRYEELHPNKGKGAAVRRGMLSAKGKYRIYTDIDIPYELDCIDKFLYYLKVKEFHLVAGDRTLPESSYFKEIPIMRRVSSQIFSKITGGLITGGWYDTQCGIKGFQAAVAQDLFGVGRINRFAFDVELLYIALKRNYDIKRMPVRLRSNETSTVRVLIDGMTMVKDVGNIRLNYFLGHYRPNDARRP